MQTVLAISFSAIALLLFYHFVERRHKLLVAKVLGVCLLIAVVVLSFLAYRNWRSHVSRDRAVAQVSVVYVAPGSSDSKTRQDSGVAFLNNLKKGLEENLFDKYKRLASMPDTVESVTFKLCNNGPDTVYQVSFEPKRIRHGRSTIEPILADMGPYPNIPFALTSDIILSPAECKELTWRGSYITRDSVFAIVYHVETERPKAR